MANIGYIYKTTNLINNKIYIGQHQRDEFDKKYYGTGKLIQRELKKYGKENFKVEIIEWLDSVDKLNEAEIKFIAAFDSKNPSIGYNISCGGQMGWMKGVHLSEETKEKIRNANAGHKFKKGEPSAFKGKYHSKESLLKMSLAKKGKQLPFNTREKARLSRLGKPLTEEHRKNISIASIGKKGTNTGKHFSEEHKRKISESQKGKIIPIESRIKMSKSHIGLKWSNKQRDAFEMKKLQIKNN